MEHPRPLATSYALHPFKIPLATLPAPRSRPTTAFNTPRFRKCDRGPLAIRRHHPATVRPSLSCAPSLQSATALFCSVALAENLALPVHGFRFATPVPPPLPTCQHQHQCQHQHPKPALATFLPTLQPPPETSTNPTPNRRPALSPVARGTGWRNQPSL